MSRTWELMVDWVVANWDKPLFQLAQGLVLGGVIVAVAWGLHRVLKRPKTDVTDDTKDFIRRVIHDREKQGFDHFTLWVPAEDYDEFVQAVAEMGVSSTCIVRPLMEDDDELQKPD